MAGALDDQQAAAEAEADGIAWSILLGLNAALVSAEDVERANVRQALERLTRCPHLRAIPMQPALVLMTSSDLVAECADCFESAEARRTPCCPACGVEAVQPLRPAVLSLGHWLAVWLLCHSCVHALATR